MIAFLKGTMAGRSADTAFVDVNGVGFAVYMPATDIVKLPEAGADVALFTHLAVREDAMTLYGFLSQEEHALFLRLIGVSGIGPKAPRTSFLLFECLQPRITSFTPPSQVALKHTATAHPRYSILREHPSAPNRPRPA